MSAPSIPAPAAVPAPAASPPAASIGVRLRRSVAFLTYPAESPLLFVTVYFVLLVGVAALLLAVIPPMSGAFAGERLAEMAAAASGWVGPAQGSGTGPSFSLEFALLLAVAMVGGFLLMVPPSVVYMATRSRKGFDQSVVHTMLLLALSVAGVIVIVRNSVALAFSLAGIVGAVRYRNNLPETRDTLFIFLSIGVGLAAGVGALPAAAALSAVFCYVVLFMVRVDYGVCELGRSSAHLLHQGAPRVEERPDGRKPKKPKDDFNAVLVVRGTSADAARSVVEPFLAREAKRWSLARVDLAPDQSRVHLKYLIRIGRKKDARDLEDALLASGGARLLGARIH